MITLSIVIPAFDEERKIALDVGAAGAFLDARRIAGEIIVSDDGSRDRTAALAAETPVPPGVERLVVRNPVHRGKGAALRSGVLASRGEYVMFADSGLTVPFPDALAGIRLIETGECDIAHGSRALPGSRILKRRDWDRTVVSRLFHAVMLRWMGVPGSLTDTQCGFKVYRGAVARELYGACVTDGFMFDIEIILLALARGLRIAEFPVEWRCDRDSRLVMRRSAPAMMGDLFRIRRRLVRPGREHPRASRPPSPPRPPQRGTPGAAPPSPGSPPHS